MWWFHKARAAWTAQRGAGWPCGLFARAPRSVAVRSLQLPALALSRFLGSSPCVRVASYLFAMATTAVQPSSRCLVQCWCKHRRCDQDLKVRIVACDFPWRLLLSSRGSSRAQVVVSGHRRVTSMELHTCTSAALWASVGGRIDCRHGLACSFGAIGCGWGRVAIAAATVATIDAPR